MGEYGAWEEELEELEELERCQSGMAERVSPWATHRES